jgi:hypothetical protein
MALIASLAGKRQMFLDQFGTLERREHGTCICHPSVRQVVPLDFREEVDRARGAKSKGWLRLLAQEVRGRRFQWIGLELVAAAQWELKDYKGGRESLEAIRAIHGDNIHANLALANIYERLHRDMKKPELLKASDQAIERVLASPDVTSTKD